MNFLWIVVAAENKMVDVYYPYCPSGGVVMKGHGACLNYRALSLFPLIKHVPFCQESIWTCQSRNSSGGSMYACPYVLWINSAYSKTCAFLTLTNQHVYFAVWPIAYKIASIPHYLWLLAGSRMETEGGQVWRNVLLSHPDVHTSVKYSQPHHPIRPLPLHLGHQEHHCYGQVFCSVARYVWEEPCGACH